MITIGIRGTKTYQVAGEGQDRPKAEVEQIERDAKLPPREASTSK